MLGYFAALVISRKAHQQVRMCRQGKIPRGGVKGALALRRSSEALKWFQLLLQESRQNIVQRLHIRMVRGYEKFLLPAASQQQEIPGSRQDQAAVA